MKEYCYRENDYIASLSKDLSKLLSKEIGRWLETVVGSPPLKTGETLASLKRFGTSPLCND